MRLSFLLVAVTVAFVMSVVPAPPVQAANCQFVLGFATLHGMIPGIVGQCLENEHHNPVNGDALQATTNGLMVWRKADNFTAFTDGFRTWINGPLGLQQRLNSQRFFWEWNPDQLPIIPAPVAGAQCHTAQLSLKLINSDIGAGNVFATFQFTNNANVNCTFFGFPGAQLLDANNNPLPTTVVRNGGSFANQPGPTTVNVPAGGAAFFKMHWEQVPVGNEVTCPTSSFIKITPPDEFASLIIPLQATACGGGRLDVTPIQATS